MRVEELIRKLQEVPANAEVSLSHDDLLMIVHPADDDLYALLDILIDVGNNWKWIHDLRSTEITAKRWRELYKKLEEGK